MNFLSDPYPGTLMKVGGCLLSALVVSALILGGSPAMADDDDDDDDNEKISEFLDDLKIRNVRRHQKAWQRIADENDGTRVADSKGYDDSAAYVIRKLERAGYEVEQQPFVFRTFQQTGPSTFEQTAPDMVTYVEFPSPSPNPDPEYDLMTHSESTDVMGTVTAVDLALDDPGDPKPPSTSTSGCEAADFAGFPAGDIALMQRGGCSFRAKAENAANAGAIGAVVFNQGVPGRIGLFLGTLGSGYTGSIAAFSISFDLGKEFAETDGLMLNLVADVFRPVRSSSNVIAELPVGRGDDDDDDDGGPSNADAPVIVMGAHLDSVPEGPGIQDNGSGSAAILEMALQLARQEVSTRNRIRFGWWGAEESGLVGSTFYVANLTQEEFNEIAANVNLDMIGSPNFVRFVYDGDGSANFPGSPPGPAGSDVIEQLFLDHFAARGLETEPTAFDGRSDYGPFINVGIPAGGLFTGAEVLKTPEQVEIYGGVAGEQYDQCYHLACDTFENISLEVLEQNTEATADVMLTLADMEMPLVAPAPITALRSFGAAETASGGVTTNFLGHELQR